MIVESKSSKFVKINKGRRILSSECALHGNKKLIFLKEKEARRFLNSFKFTPFGFMYNYIK